MQPLEAGITQNSNESYWDSKICGSHLIMFGARFSGVWTTILWSLNCIQLYFPWKRGVMKIFPKSCHKYRLHSLIFFILVVKFFLKRIVKLLSLLLLYYLFFNYLLQKIVPRYRFLNFHILNLTNKLTFNFCVLEYIFKYVTINAFPLSPPPLLCASKVQPMLHMYFFNKLPQTVFYITL